MAIDNTWNFNRDDVYNDRCTANVGGAFEAALKHPEMVAERIAEIDIAHDMVQFVQFTDEGTTAVATITAKRNVVWFTDPAGNVGRRVIPTGKHLLQSILVFIEEIEFGF